MAQNITFLELVPILVALTVWGPLLRNKYVYFHTDNEALSFCLNKLTSKEPLVMESIRSIVRLTLSFNIMIRAKHIAGFLNSMADALSRQQIDVFRGLHPEAEMLPATVPALQDLLPCELNPKF